jgi:hypothetical protein
VMVVIKTRGGQDHCSASQRVGRALPPSSRTAIGENPLTVGSIAKSLGPVNPRNRPTPKVLWPGCW